MVHPLTSATEQEWENFVKSHPDGNCYHSLLWRSVVHEVFGHQPLYVLAECEGKITGVLPLFYIRIPLVGSKVVSLPYDIGSGGVLALDAHSARALFTHAINLAKELRVDYLQFRMSAVPAGCEDLGLVQSTPVIISEMRLTSEEEILAGISKDHRKGIRKAETRGVSVREATRWEDFLEFFRVYLEVFRDFGTPPYGEQYFRFICQRLLPVGATRLLIAEVEGKCVGGLLLFCGGKNLVSKFAVCLPDYVDRRTYVLLYWEAIRLGLNMGYAKLSWGTSSKGQTGLISFKEGWGATSRPALLLSLPIQKSVPDIEHYYDSAGLARRLWMKLPVLVTRTFGPFLNRWYC